ncbi:MAG: hypothetical protein WA990_00510 [Rubrobacteraceae bacterium]
MAQMTEASGGLGKQDHGRGSRATALNGAVRVAFQVYRYRELENNLKTLGWRKARRRVLAGGALSGEWVRRNGSEVRLTRRGLEVCLSGEETRLLSWQELWECARR